MSNQSNKKHRKKRKRNYFKKGLLAYLIFLCVIFVGIWIILWNKLSSYQSNLDSQAASVENEKSAKRAPQLCFEDKLSSMSIDDWINVYYSSNSEDYNKEDDVKNFISEILSDGDISRWKSPEYTDQSPVYVVKNNEENIAKFHLSDDASNNWNISSIDFLPCGNETYSITVPVNTQLICNSQVVNPDLSHDADSFTLNGYEDSLESPIDYVTYEINELISEPDVEINCTLDDYNLSTDVEGNYYLALKDGASYQKSAQSFVDSLLYYYASGKNNVSANMASAVNQVASSSTASSIIRQSLDGVTWRQPSGITYVTTYSDAFVLAENCYFVDISYKDSKSEEDKYEIYRVYFLNLGSGFKIYNFEMK